MTATQPDLAPAKPDPAALRQLIVAIILIAAGIYVVSLLFGPVSGLVRQMFPGRHLEA